jgi:hypothetical protein
MNDVKVLKMGQLVFSLIHATRMNVKRFLEISLSPEFLR